MAVYIFCAGLLAVSEVLPYIWHRVFTQTSPAMQQPLKVLFVSGRNRRRSPTAETIFRDDPRLTVRSVGPSDSSKKRITEGDLLWADLILVMERKYAARIRALFPDAVGNVGQILPSVLACSQLSCCRSRDGKRISGAVIHFYVQFFSGKMASIILDMNQ